MLTNKALLVRALLVNILGFLEKKKTKMAFFTFLILALITNIVKAGAY